MYKLTNDGIITKVEPGKLISFPADERNRDYRQYLAWLAEGNTPEPADPEPVTKQEPTVDEKLRALQDALVSKGVIAVRDVDEKRSAEVVRDNFARR